MTAKRPDPTMGPLAGVRVLELAGIGPAPFAGMMLADMGAEVLRIDRIRADTSDDWWLSHDILSRGRRSVAVDLKDPEAVDMVLALGERADLFIEGYRPGVAERMGLGPDELRARNPRLVYGRMTGWGQDGPLADKAGHDIDYLAITGALGAIGPMDGPPIPPLNLIADFGGGGMLLAFGLVCGLLNARGSGHGQVVDAAMVDGACLLTAWIHTLRNAGSWVERRGANLLDGGAPNYGTYETANGEYLAVGAMEPQFLRRLLQRLDIQADLADQIGDPANWPGLRAELARAFRAKTQAQWLAWFAEDDVCVAPVASFAEAPDHPHIRARGALVPTADGYQPAPAPRFSRTPAGEPGLPTLPGARGREALREWGISAETVEKLVQRSVVRVT